MRSFSFILVLLFSFSLLADKRPQVLIIGDSIYSEVARQATGILKDKANVAFVKNSSWNSSFALANFNKLLEGKKWDLIVFNYGLNDIMYKHPSIKKSVRAMHKDAGGIHAVSETQYEKNLNELIKRFRAAGAKVIWASTTPVFKNTGILIAGDEVKYNSIAAKVMQQAKVPIVDMYSHGQKIQKTNPKKNTYSYRSASQPLHPPIVKGIVKELKLAKPVKGPVNAFIMIGDEITLGNGLIRNSKQPQMGKPGTLDELVLKPETAASYKHLITADKKWASRNDVWVHSYNRNSGKLMVGLGGRGNMFGPELGFGFNMGAHLNQQVLIFKPDMRRTLTEKNYFRPEHGNYQTILQQIKTSIGNIDDTFPDYTSATGYKIAGLVINYSLKEKDLKTYGPNLIKLVTSLRKDLNIPKLPVVIVGAGQADKYAALIKIQQSSAAKLSNAKFIDASKFWPDIKKSSDKSPDRWYGNAESFYKLGFSIAEEMKKLL